MLSVGAGPNDGHQAVGYWLGDPFYHISMTGLAEMRWSGFWSTSGYYKEPNGPRILTTSFFVLKSMISAMEVVTNVVTEFFDTN